METLRFDFKVRSSADGKSNILCVTSIGTPDGRTFLIPNEYQQANLHTELIKTTPFAKIRKTLTKRHQSRKIWIKLSEELAEVYLDEGLNIQFDNNYLEELIEEEPTEEPKQSSEETITKLLEKLLEAKQRDPETQNLKKIAEKFILEKFTNKNSNAHQWINEFERECERFAIVKEKEKIEILKFFLEKSALDWYSCMLLKLTINSNWEEWKTKFCETYANKGWSLIRYTLAFKYQTGPLLDYAIKKEKLLLEMRKSIDTDTLIDLIATGLPNFVADRIDREAIQGTEDLYNEIGKLEHLVNKKTFENKRYQKNSDAKEKTEKKPCTICKEKKKSIRYHPEHLCWFKTEEEKIKSINNQTLEVELNDNNPKN